MEIGTRWLFEGRDIHTQLSLSASCFVPVMSFHPRRLTGSSFVVMIVGGRLQGHNFDLCGNRNLQQLSHLSIICLFTRFILLLLIVCKATDVMSIYQYCYLDAKQRPKKHTHFPFKNIGFFFLIFCNVNTY